MTCVWLLALTVVLAACTLGAPPPTVAPTVVPSLSAVATPSSCLRRGALPDSLCTPGVTDPRVTQANISSTICVPGYTATVRPPASYTDSLKREQMARYGDIGDPAAFEEDHYLPLELGGDPRDPRNLWPEPRRVISSPGAEDKDRLENALHAKVCGGTMPLTDAQTCILTDWEACYRRIFNAEP